MEQKAYCILEPNGKHLRINTIKTQRRDCIAEFIGDSKMIWAECKKIGWQCIKVKILR